MRGDQTLGITCRRRLLEDRLSEELAIENYGDRAAGETTKADLAPAIRSTFRVLTTRRRQEG